IKPATCMYDDGVSRYRKLASSPDSRFMTPLSISRRARRHSLSDRLGHILRAVEVAMADDDHRERDEHDRPSDQLAAGHVLTEQHPRRDGRHDGDAERHQ